MYVPFLMKMIVRSRLLAGTESIAACTVVKFPEPSAATTMSGFSSEADAARLTESAHENKSAERTKRSAIMGRGMGYRAS